MMLMQKSKLETDGFAIEPALADEKVIAALSAAIDDAALAVVRTKRQSVHAIRNLLDLPAVRAWVASRPVRAVIEPILGRSAIAVRGILFDKTPAANWKVAWHQDLSIAVAERRDVKGFGPWSVKEGVIHVQPPAWVLEGMCTIRLHLDDCGESNGPLKVIGGSHRDGVLSPVAVAAKLAAGLIVPCCTRAGGAVLMRPLLLHASSAATEPSRRRVVHVEFASTKLPGGVAWAKSI